MVSGPSYTLVHLPLAERRSGDAYLLSAQRTPRVTCLKPFLDADSVKEMLAFLELLHHLSLLENFQANTAFGLTFTMPYPGFVDQSPDFRTRAGVDFVVRPRERVVV